MDTPWYKFKHDALDHSGSRRFQSYPSVAQEVQIRATHSAVCDFDFNIGFLSRLGLDLTPFHVALCGLVVQSHPSLEFVVVSCRPHFRALRIVYTVKLSKGGNALEALKRKRDLYFRFLEAKIKEKAKSSKVKLFISRTGRKFARI